MTSIERKVSAEAAYGLYNFHREAHLEQLAARIASPKGQSIAILSGPDGIGRGYLVRAAAHRLSRRGQAVHVLPIDLESFNPDEGDALFQFLKHQVQHRSEIEQAQREEILEGMRPLLRFSDVASFGKAAAISLMLGVKGPLKVLFRFFSDSEKVGLPQGSDRAFFRHVLEDLTESGTMVVTVETALLPTTFRRWLVEEAERDGSHMFLAVRAAPDAATEDVAPLAAGTVERIEIEPLTLEELREVLDLRFDPHQFSAELADTLHARTRGEPGHLAALTYDLVRGDALQTTLGTWHLPPGGMESPEVVEALQADGYEAVERVLANEPTLAEQLQEFLLLAALGGEIIPADLLFQYLKISDEVRDEILDCLDDDLGEDLGRLEDLGYHGHRSFLGLGLLYRFATPVFRRIVLNRIDSWARDDRAAVLLPFLKKHLPVRNREIARYFLNVCRHLDEKKQEPYLQELAWWVGLEELDQLKILLTEAIDEERLDLEALWLAAIDRSDERWWHPRRRLMFLDLYEQYEMPMDHLARWHRERAGALHEMGRYREALTDAERAVDLSEGIELAVAKNTLASIQLGLGELRTAERNSSQAFNLLATQFGPRHPWTLTAQHNLANILHSLGNYTESEALYRSALAIKVTVLVQNHPSSLTTQNNLASVLKDQGKYPEAELMYRSVHEVQTKVLGKDHPSTLNTHHNLAGILYVQGQYSEAGTIYRTVLDARIALLGRDHPDTLSTQHELAGILKAEGRYGEAEAAYRNVLDERTTLLGEDHPDTLMTRHNLAAILGAQGHYAEAEDLFRAVLEASTRHLGDAHPATLVTQHALAIFLRAQGHHSEADTLRQENLWQEAEDRCLVALSGRQRKLGEGHPDTLESKKLLEEIRKDRAAAESLGA